jgi:hypothetical protein
VAPQDQPAANPWRPYQPAVQDDLDALTRTIETIRSLTEGLATDQGPSVSPRHVLVEGHLLRLLAESVYWNLHDSERWHGAPRCGRVPPTERKVAYAPCGREYGHDGLCVDVREDMDDVIERARALATAAGRLDHGVASLSLSVNRRRYDGAAVDAAAREILRLLPDRLIWIARGALDFLDRLEQSSDIQRWVWRPPPELAPPTRRASRPAT